MGIQGLIPFLEKASRPINISQYAGCTVAIDAYCWLHKGAFSCADKLARGDKTDAYVHYCMKYVNMLLSHNIKPILVFDGRHLPAKAGTEKKRRESRDVNRRRAAELLRQDKPNEARTFLQRCVDVTHLMALQLMRAARSRNVDCITAPYEADAQLAYLNIQNIAHVVITEDSDLLLFGCSRVVFKLDLNGNGLLVEQDRLHLAMGLTAGSFSLDRFRHMCILSGCDYLPSLPGIGLVKACRFIKSTVDPDIHRALSRLGGHLNMSLCVPLEYRDNFMDADAMFKYQPVFDPLTRQLQPLTAPPASAPPPPLLKAETLSPAQLQDLAYGNLDPFTLQQLDDWFPGKPTNVNRSTGWSSSSAAPHRSIWSSEYQRRPLVVERPDPCLVHRPSTQGRVLPVDPPCSSKRPSISAEEELNALRLQFGSSAHADKKPRFDDKEILQCLDKGEQTPPKPPVKTSTASQSPKKAHANPFSKETPASNKFSGLSKLAQFRKTTVSESNVVQSRYFGSSSSHLPATHSEEKKRPEQQSEKLQDVSNRNEEKSPTKIKNIFPPKLTSVEKLSDNNISLLIEDLAAETKTGKEIENKLKGKENLSNDNAQLKREHSFKWKPSLSDMFGFKSKSLPSSPAVRSSFVTPLKEAEGKLQENYSSNNLPSKNQTEIKPVRRNPFAKTTKDEDTVSLNSQGSSIYDNSQPDNLTSDLILSSSKEPIDTMILPEEPLSAPPRLNSMPKPRVKVGLSKTSTNSCPKNLLSMFGFKSKPKLQL